MRHPFWQGVEDFERGKDLDYSKHPAWVHGWQKAEEWNEDHENEVAQFLGTA